MEELFILLIVLFVGIIVISAIVLPIVTLLTSVYHRRKLNERLTRLEAGHLPGPTPDGAATAREIQELAARIERIEAALAANSILPGAIPGRERPVAPAPQAPSEPVASSVPPPVDMPAVPPTLARHLSADEIESMIGRRWVGWAAVGLILFATAFFLKYAFDNRWIGELGRVAIGVMGGVILVSLGFKYHRRNWRVFSQILTGGGVVLLYLSAYAAFGYYHLVPQRTAFVYLAILVAEATALALLYNAPAIAIMALIGGFLTPLLLHSDRGQDRALFGYLVAIDVGALAVLRHWTGLRTLAFVGTHLLFWIWYGERYHPQKLLAVMVFQSVVFLIFLLAHIGRRLLDKASEVTVEDVVLMTLNPFVFFATGYYLLNPGYHDWMGVFAIAMAVVYAGSAKLLLDRSATTRPESLALIGVALTFVTIAIPIQLRSNWITIAWAVEALIMLWAGIETRAQRLRALSYILFGLALVKLVTWDTPYQGRLLFTPIFNRYFLSSIVVIGCLFAAAVLRDRIGKRRGVMDGPPTVLFFMLGAVAVWFLLSVETITFFGARANIQKAWEDANHERWLGQMALSVVWAAYATLLATIGFIRRSSATRWAALSLFLLTIIKAMLVDIASLQRLYRIVVFFVLGLLLLVVAWAYHRMFYARESSK